MHLTNAKKQLDAGRVPTPHWKRAIAELKKLQLLHITTVRAEYAREMIEWAKKPIVLASKTESASSDYHCFYNDGIKTLQSQGCDIIPDNLTLDMRTFQHDYGRDVIDLIKRQEINATRGMTQTPDEPKPPKKRTKKKPRV